MMNRNSRTIEEMIDVFSDSNYLARKLILIADEDMIEDGKNAYILKEAAENIANMYRDICGISKSHATQAQKDTDGWVIAPGWDLDNPSSSVQMATSVRGTNAILQLALIDNRFLRIDYLAQNISKLHEIKGAGKSTFEEIINELKRLGYEPKEN